MPTASLSRFSSYAKQQFQGKLHHARDSDSAKGNARAVMDLRLDN
jgi:hypothetical protein